MTPKPDVEAYFGCDCHSLEHVTHFWYFPPEKDDDENVIYVNVKASQYLNCIFPPFSFHKYDWEYYFRNNFFNRIIIGMKYICKKNHTEKDGIFSSADFMNKDLPAIKDFLNNLTIKTTKEMITTSVIIDNDDWRLKFCSFILDKDFPDTLVWEIHFLPKNILGRIKQSLKYIFERFSDDQCFELNEENTIKLKKLIEYIEKANKCVKELSEKMGK